MLVKDCIQGLQHIGIPTKKMEASIAFYENLGFQLMNEEEQVNGGAVAFLELKGLVIELWELEEDRQIGAIDHIALDVIKIDELYQAVKELPYPIVSNGIESLHYWKKGIRFFIVEGPNQEKIEFCQINL
ncbi:VOC family protein [Enterococcus sp. 669A]|uniref:VOC family protein n=1 Tax=Candidatus Enterococcus moelleringii TaxID=2815325 RepID=A0ABS3L4Z2_9ENTE|nr:VOC family protein [Enterococcus sp. 669A]MBO1304689.1 VOC family protein [Enterococcus sp. 669A]